MAAGHGPRRGCVDAADERHWSAVPEPAFAPEDLFDEDYLYFYAERTDEAHSDAETDLIWSLLDLKPGMDVLDLACGHGRIANRLAKRGCHVTGLDSASLFLDRARQDAAARGVTVDYVQGDMRHLPWTGRFDRVINWFTAFGYFTDGDNKRVLAEVLRTLRPGGRLVLDLNHYAWLIRHYQPASVRELDGDLLIDQNRLDVLTGRNIVQRTVIRAGRTRQVPFSVRLFTFTELRDWLLDAGFTNVAGYGEDGTPLAPENRRMIVVAQR
ncbi:class I SAM-dependent methyltransferase [Kibdelosporangium philippinense]|uniref:Class I SAM-dependent methyltransferase n=1 Tax=Kibdelosporangium philippinense TaxID=211113 RepID=A0ABS8ZVU2_9PSEU|nr:class I SAM-dependent methyltransferase [Kibdelosporangium philippinense]MCE7011804.1 class I SAM-dependent methyltransferase [Kibdelosporangium philippinense]